MRKGICLALCLIAAGISGCQLRGSSGKEKAADVSPKGDGVLVAYFSHTGNTEKLAEIIAEHTGGTLFEIETEEEYPEDYEACVEAAAKEREEEARPKLSSHVENIEEFNIVFLGYPIWWGTVPMAVCSFAEEYDFDGKTVIPFSTHGGSGMGRSERDLSGLCEGARFLEGFSVKGSEAGAAGENVAAWLEELER